MHGHHWQGGKISLEVVAEEVSVQFWEIYIFLFPHVASPHPQGPPWWNTLETSKIICQGRKADTMEMENEEI